MIAEGSRHRRRASEAPITESEVSYSRVTLNRSHVFWILNTSGWLLFAWIDVLLEYRTNLADHRLLVFHAVAFAAGFLITIPMRYTYRAALRKRGGGPGIDAPGRVAEDLQV